MNDILFGNNNRKILKRLAKADLKAHKLKTSLTAIIILIATSLMAVVLSVLNNDALSQANDAPYHAVYRAVSAQTRDVILNDRDFETVGIYKGLGSTVLDDEYMNLAYMDRSTMSFMGFHLVKGDFPVDENCVMVSKAFSEHHALSMGDCFDFAYTDSLTNRQLAHTFQISGIIENKEQETAKQYYILTSDAFRIAVAKQTDPSMTSSFSTQTPSSVDMLVKLNAKQCEMSPDQQKAFLKEKGIAYGVEGFDIVLNNRYIEGFTMEGTVLVGIMAFVIFLMFASSFVIYSIFYIAVINAMPMYAKLMSLGTTERQLGTFLKIQGNILALRFIPLGMFLSLILIICMSGVKWLLHDIAIILLSGALSYIVIKLALQKPKKLLSNTTPIEAMKYLGGIQPQKHKALKHITPGTLAKNNLSYNASKNRMSIISLSISGTLMIALSILISSINLPAMLLQSYPVNEDFQIGIQMDNFYERFPQIIQNNPLSGEIEQEILSIPGVEKIIKEEVLIGRLVEPQIEYGDPSDNVELINSLSPELLNNVSETVNGNINYDNIGSNDIVINQYRIDRSKLNYGDIQVGDTLRFQFDIGGNEVEQIFEVVGIAYFPSTELFYTTAETINRISPYNNNSHFSVVCNSISTERVEDKLQMLIAENPDLRLKIYDDEYSMIQGFVGATMSGLYGISAFVMLFGLLNMINMLISSAIIRKKEFALLQAVGMTNQQLRKMLYREGLSISTKSAFTATILGILVGRLFCYLANEVMALKFIIFNLDAFPILLFVVLLIGLQSCVSYAICHFNEKDTLTERLRTE